MPDLIDRGEAGVHFWPTERCASCTVRDDCPLIAALFELKITAAGTFVVWLCDRYTPDEESPYYVDLETVDPSASMLSDLKELLARLKELTGGTNA